MAVIHCGQEPGDCGSFADSGEVKDIFFTTSTGNPVLLGARGVTGICYTVYDPAAGRYVGSMNGTVWHLYPFHIEARGRVEFSYNSAGELIVTIRGLSSTLTGSAGDIGRAFQAPLYTCGDFSLALSVSTTNAVPGAGWNTCFGGWWSACVTGGSACTVDAYGNPCGGTMYWWNRWDRYGTPYEHHGNTPTRLNDGISFNVGKVTAGQPIFIWARAARGGCGGYFSSLDGNAVQCLVYTAPPMSICPPTLNSIEMTRDICESTVDAVLNVHIPELGTSGVTLRILYEACTSESAWSDSAAGTISIANVPEKTDLSIDLAQYGVNLVPNTVYYFKMYLTNGEVESDSVMVCDNRTLFIPPVNCIVPELTAEECETLITGDCLPEFESDADMEECC